MKTEGNEAQEKLVPVWLPTADWKLVRETMNPNLKSARVIEDAISWAEGR